MLNYPFRRFLADRIGNYLFESNKSKFNKSFPKVFKRINNKTWLKNLSHLKYDVPFFPQLKRKNNFNLLFIEGETTAADATTAAAEGSGSGGEAVAATTAGNYLSIIPSIYLPIYPTMYLSIHLSIYQSFCTLTFYPIYLSIYLSIDLYDLLTFNLSIHLCIYKFIYSYIHSYIN